MTPKAFSDDDDRRPPVDRYSQSIARVLQGYLALVETDLKKAHTDHSPMKMVDQEDKRRKHEASSGPPAKPGRNNHPSRKARKRV